MRVAGFRLIVAAAAILLMEIADLATSPAALIVLAATCWMGAWGVWMARQILPTHRTLAWLIGPALGLAFGPFGTFLLWCLGIRNALALAAGPWLCLAIGLAARRWGGPTLRLATFGRRHAAALAVALLVVPLVTWLPYRHIRQDVGDGEAYRAYFTADFIWAMTVTAEVSRGDVPPANPFLTDRPLHYYWMAHFLSGATYRTIASWGVRVEDVVLINGVLFSITAVLFLYAIAVLSGAGPRLALLAVAGGFLANSYEGADMIRAIIVRGQPWSELTTVNIDAVTRWFYQGMPVDGLQRMLLYQPHHFTGYLCVLMALWLSALAEDIGETSVALWAGILLAFGLLFSTFTALIGGAAVGLVFAVRIIQRRAWRSAWQSLILGAAPVAVGVGLITTLGYADQRYGSLLVLGVNAVALEHLGRVLFLNFGPLLLGGAATLLRPRWMLADGTAPTALAIAALAFYFFTNVPDSGDVWVGWRAGHLLLIAFAIMSVTAIGAVWRALGSRVERAAVAVGVTIAALLALPTVAIDVYNAQDTGNRGQGADFPWTLVITPPEREALDWIRAETPATAVVQVEPYVRGSTHWAYVPAFAERRSAAGLPIAMTPIRPYREASDQVYRGIYRSRSPDKAHNVATFMKIEYLVVGTPERRAYPDSIAGLVARPDLFVRVFHNEEMTIFRVQ